MRFDEYDAAAGRTVNARLDDRDRLLDAAAGLAEEGGEVLGLVRKHLFMGHALDRDRLATELGDALWCLAMTARAAGLTLDAVAEGNLAKLRVRYPEGYSDARSKDRD
ncbi:MAG: nucleoside triphosphate pyrophosphohydrolase family protein [Gemmatimonadaceae bacterium]